MENFNLWTRVKYILKPQHNVYCQMPENEDLTMVLAEITGLEIPIHGLIKFPLKVFHRFTDEKPMAVKGVETPKKELNTCYTGT
jgi:hypothetical protein